MVAQGHTFDTFDYYLCSCGENVQNGNIDKMLTTFIWDEKRQIVIQTWWHVKCYKKHIKKKGK